MTREELREKSAFLREKEQKLQNLREELRTWQEQKDYEIIEAVIAGIEDHIAELDRQINLSATDFVKLGKLTQEKEEQESLLDEKMERYLYLTDLAEQIEAQKNVK